MPKREIYQELDAALRETVEDYTLGEVLQRLAAVIRALPCRPDFECPGGKVFSDRAWHEQVASALDELSV